MRQAFYLFKTMYYVYDMIIVCDGYYLFRREWNTQRSEQCAMYIYVAKKCICHI